MPYRLPPQLGRGKKTLWYAQLPWATYLLICQGGYSQEAAQLHSCLSHQQVDVRNDDLGIGGPPACLNREGDDVRHDDIGLGDNERCVAIRSAMATTNN